MGKIKNILLPSPAQIEYENSAKGDIIKNSKTSVVNDTINTEKDDNNTNTEKDDEEVEVIKGNEAIIEYDDVENDDTIENITEEDEFILFHVLNHPNTNNITIDDNIYTESQNKGVNNNNNTKPFESLSCNVTECVIQ